MNSWYCLGSVHPCAGLLAAGDPSALPAASGMMGWIDRVVPQPPVPHVTEETPVQELEPAKVSREPAWGVMGTP